MSFRGRQLLAVALSGLALGADERSGEPVDASGPRFRVIAFAGPTGDQAHVSFVGEAQRWLGERARERKFAFTWSTNWAELNPETLARQDVVVFLNARPDTVAARDAFRRYMEAGGAWIGFHFAAFALTPSAVPQDWDWYHVELLGAGAYAGNTWKPTPAVLRVEAPLHPVMAGLPATFRSAPNEWYKWVGDLRHNPAIQVLVSIDLASFPLGTGPKEHEIWHAGDYPVVWTHRKYRMVYFNMGHDDMDYGQRPPRAVSSSFASPEQNRMVMNALEWLGGLSGVKSRHSRAEWGQISTFDNWTGEGARGSMNAAWGERAVGNESGCRTMRLGSRATGTAGGCPRARRRQLSNVEI